MTRSLVRFASALLHVWLLAWPAISSAQSMASLPRIPEIEAADRLALRQIDQWIDSDQIEQAVDQIIRLSDHSGDRLIQVLPFDHAVSNDDETPADSDNRLRVPRESPLSRLQHWVPLRAFLNDRLLRWSVAKGDVAVAYRKRIDPIARVAFEAARQTKSLTDAQRVADAFLATSYGDDALLLVADLAMERGWVEVARGAITRIDRRLQATGIGNGTVDQVPAVPWNHLLAATAAPVDQVAVQVSRPDVGLAFGTYVGSDLPLPRVALRIPYASLLNQETERAANELALCRALFSYNEDDSFVAMLQKRIDRSEGTSNRRELPSKLDHFPRWTVDLQSTSPTDPFRSANVAAMSPSFLPTLWKKRVIVQDVNHIVAFDLQTGKPWPTLDQVDVKLFDSGQPADQWLPPANLPADGAPQFSLQVDQNRLMARLGPAVSGWLPVVNKSPESASSIAVFDLSIEGGLLDAYPRSLDAPRWEGYEFEGTPTLVGDRIFCGITRREGSLLTSRVVCLDTRSAAVLWASPELTTGTMLSDRAVNRVTHARVVHRQGMLFYQAALGVVVSLDAETGQPRWLVRYPRGDDDDSPYHNSVATTSRRDGSPVLLDGQQAIAAPADSDRIFSLDSTTGRPLWVTAPERAINVQYLLGTTSTHLIVSGQQLYWIDKLRGTVDRAFPGGRSHATVGGSVTRGSAGRGIVDDEQIYWPTDEAILVFGLNGGWIDRIDLQSVDLQGEICWRRRRG
ncbi:MAG: PQQ-binding-like beta-propeller repeat protein [Pirellulaceae bacterium]